MNYEMERFESIDSTNDYAKTKREDGKNLIVIANSQTGGRGTKGRRFSSKRGGLYVSVLTFYEQFPATRAFEIMQKGAVAVCETLERFGLQPKIKWPNDIYVNGKKICGILVENTFSGNMLSSSIVGIGLNIQNDLEEELLEIATSMYRETGKRFLPSEVERTLLRFLQTDNQEKYQSYLGFIGEEVSLLCGEKREKATFLGVDKQGNLTVKQDGETRVYASAEISLRTGERL